MNLAKLTYTIEQISETQIQSLRDIITSSDQVILIGNGGSNSIAAHMAVDYSKFLNVRSVANDSSPMMTMLINDYGMEQAYARFLKYHATHNTTAIVISSSGNSENCVQAANLACELGLSVVLLSGFDHNNKLNSLRSEHIKLKYWVDSSEFGVVEMAHHVFLHAIV